MKKIFLVSLLALFLVAGTASANHSWGKYHWDISTAESEINPLVLGNNLTTSAWDNSLAGASSDWNDSVLINEVVSGGSNPNCYPTPGKVEVCNGEYGTANGWLGIASIWIKRGRSGHIVQGVVKVNDSYFNMEEYGTQAWKNYVMCQEVGHTFGLGHQDVDSGDVNLGTCMDYTNDPDGKLADPDQLDNQHPNDHDYDMMTKMYAHLNSPDEGGGPGNGNGGGKGKKPKKAGVGADIDLNDPSSWGQAIRQDAQGNDSVFERNLGNGQTLITHVIWVE